MITIYLAAPLFDQAQRAWNKEFSEALKNALQKVSQANFEIVLPQDFKPKNRYGTRAFAEEAYHHCLSLIDRSTAVVAILDGCQVDDGTAFEVGYAVAKGVPILGVRTDARPGEYAGCNVMLAIGCSVLVVRPNTSLDDRFFIGTVAKALIRTLRRESGEE